MHTEELHKTRIEWTDYMVQFLQENYGYMPTKDIAKHLNCTEGRVCGKAGRLGLKGRKKKNKTIKDIPEIFNVSSMEKTKDGKVKAQCPYCKKYFYTKPSALALGRRKSCGCVNKGQRRGSEHISANYWGKLYKGALKRNIEFNISIDYANQLLVSQNFKCKLSNINLSFGYIDLKDFTASLDRIDSSKGYVEGNVQWVHKYVNIMKNCIDQDSFLYICGEVYKNKKDEIESLGEHSIKHRKYKDWEKDYA